MEDSKALFFAELQSLGKNSEDGEEDEDSNEMKTLLLSKPSLFMSPNAPFASSPTAEEVLRRKKQVSTPTSSNPTPPTLHRTRSASLKYTQIVPETPAPQRKEPLSHPAAVSDDITSSTSFTHAAPSEAQTPASKRPKERRTVSTPKFGSVVMINSKGITDMLSNNKTRKPPAPAAARKEAKKRKSSSLSAVPEGERIFQGKVFFYIPANDIAKPRRDRIAKAVNYGAVWTKEWIPEVTHVVVDDPDIHFGKALAYLRDKWKVYALPSDVVIVNRAYPMDCILQKHIFNPDQPQYRVKGSSEPQLPQILLPLQKSDEVVPPVEKHGRDRVIITPPRLAKDDPPPYSPVFHGLDFEGHDGDEVRPYLVDSPRQMSPAAPTQYHSFGELDEFINAARAMEHLDADDDDDERPSSSDSVEEDAEEPGSEGERAHKAAARKKQRTVRRGTFNQEHFSCMQGGTGIALDSNPNRKTIEILQQMADYYERMKDSWRSRAYRMAIGVLKKQPGKISTYDEAIALRTIGHRLATKIEEIVTTNHLRRLEDALVEPGDKSLQLFMKVYSAGLAQAEKWVGAGHRTLEDLSQHAQLTPNQRIGVDHYHDFLQRIPRSEVTALGQVVQDAAAQLDPSVEVILSGSYRRGAASSGDVDFMVTRPGTSSTNELLPFLNDLVVKLTDSGFLVAALAVPSRWKDTGSKWHGACVLPASSPLPSSLLSSSPVAASTPFSPSPVNKTWRRIDILLVPETEFGAALIYFTGDDIFNRSMRLLARKKGMRLNQRGLYNEVLRGQGGAKLTDGTLLEGRDEKRIFAALEVPWRPPNERICQ